MLFNKKDINLATHTPPPQRAGCTRGREWTGHAAGVQGPRSSGTQGGTLPPLVPKLPAQCLQLPVSPWGGGEGARHSHPVGAPPRGARFAAPSPRTGADLLAGSLSEEGNGSAPRTGTARPEARACTPGPSPRSSSGTGTSKRGRFISSRRMRSICTRSQQHDSQSRRCGQPERPGQTEGYTKPAHPDEGTRLGLLRQRARTLGPDVTLSERGRSHEAACCETSRT